MSCPKVKTLLFLSVILLGSLRVSAADLFRAVAVDAEWWEVTFKPEGVRYRVVVDDAERGVSGYSQTLRMKHAEKLTLVEKHSKLEIRPVDEEGRKGIEIKATAWDMRSGKDVVTTTFEAEHREDQTAVVPREGEALKLEAKDGKVTVETNEMKVPEEQVRSILGEALQNYFVVSANDFAHRFSHVALMDATGTIEWPAATPPVTWKWTLRPGGLAILKKPDGEVICLAREKPESTTEGAGKPMDGR